MSFSLQAAQVKWGGSLPWFGNTGIWSTTSNLAALDVNGCSGLVGWYGTVERETLVRGRLVEVVGYEDGTQHVLYAPSDEESFLVRPIVARPRTVDSFALTFICTSDEPYRSLMRDTLLHYMREAPEVPLRPLVYGPAAAEMPGGNRTVCTRVEGGEFHMAEARNLSLRETADFSHVFMLDCDVRMRRADVERVLAFYRAGAHEGVLNLKDRPEDGNGLYFGDRQLLVDNGYDERFRHFWGEDTEFLMNFSRRGITPVVLQVPLARVDHSREKTNRYYGTNTDLLRHIITKGSR